MKVRCELDAVESNRLCRRCAKAGRICGVINPIHEHRKDTDSRLSKLERGINALMSTLNATPQDDGRTLPAEQVCGKWASMASAIQNEGDSRGQETATRDRGPETQELEAAPQSGQMRKYLEIRKASEDLRHVPSAASIPSSAISQLPTPLSELTEESSTHEYSDIVDRGIITMDKAKDLWVRYREQMMPHLPAVVFHADMTVAALRRSKPILFLAIMCAASSEMPGVQRVLVQELMPMLADKIVVIGEENMELLQALHITIIWCSPPEEHFERLGLYQLVHIATVMAIDIGLGEKTPWPHKTQTPCMWWYDTFREHETAEPASVEARRAWLTCYYLTSNASMIMHRPNLLSWTPFMAECVDILETSTDAAPTDRFLCHLVWTHHLAETSIHFLTSGPGFDVNMSESKVRTQYLLSGYERDSEEYYWSVPKKLDQPSLKLSFYISSLYVHGIALLMETANMRAQCTFTSKALLPARVRTVSACLKAVDGIFNIFLSVDIAVVRCLPAFDLTRVAYATMLLMEICSEVSDPNFEAMGDHATVEKHVETLIEKFRVTATNDKSCPVASLRGALLMMRSWFQKQDRKGEANESNLIGRTPAVAVVDPPSPPLHDEYHLL